MKNIFKRHKKKFTAVLMIIGLYLIFLIYSNVNLTPEREYVFYESLEVNGNVIEYNEEIIEGAEPIFIPGSGEKAVLLLHGMGGTPVELRDLAYCLAEKNITVLVPLLPSQGRTYKEIGEIDREEVYDSSKEFLDILKQDYDEVYVGGLCTGGMLALRLAEEEEFDGVISLSTPTTSVSGFLGDSPYYVLKLARLLTPNLRRIEYGLARDRSVAEVLPSFDRLPVRTLLQEEMLRMETRDDLGKVTEPILIMQSRFDNRAAPVSAEYIYEHVNSIDREIIYLDNSGHVITMDYDKEIVFSEVFEFINRN